MGEKPLDDAGLLSDAARSVMESEFDPDERIVATMPGNSGTALIVTDRRIAIWKDKALRSWAYRDLTGLTLEGGGFGPNYLALQGPDLPTKKLGFGDVSAAVSAVQITDKKRAALVVEAAHRTGSNPPAVLPASRGGGRVAGQGLEGAVLVAKGVGGRITLYEDKIKIKHEGLWGFTKGIYKGDKEIPIDQITAIQWRNPSRLASGHIQFTIMGGSSDSRAGSIDENSMMFNNPEMPEFERLKVEVEKRMAVFREARLGNVRTSVSPPQPDIPDQIRKLAELREVGILTDDEFSSKKAELLSRL